MLTTWCVLDAIAVWVEEEVEAVEAPGVSVAMVVDSAIRAAEVLVDSR